MYLFQDGQAHQHSGVEALPVKMQIINPEELSDKGKAGVFCSSLDRGCR